MSNKKLWTSAIVVAIATIANHAQASIVKPGVDANDYPATTLDMRDVVRGPTPIKSDGTVIDGTVDVQASYHHVSVTPGIHTINSIRGAVYDARDLGTSAASGAVTADFASLDSGTFTLDFQALVAVTDPAPADFGGGEITLSRTAKYQFVPSLDSLLTLNFASNEVRPPNGGYLGASLGWVVITLGDSTSYSALYSGQSNAMPLTFTRPLLADSIYTLRMAYTGQLTPSVTSVLTGQLTLDFAITELPKDPTDPTVPAPGSGSLLLAGLLLLGIRKRGRQSMRSPAATD